MVVLFASVPFVNNNSTLRYRSLYNSTVLFIPFIPMITRHNTADKYDKVDQNGSAHLGRAVFVVT